MEQKSVGQNNSRDARPGQIEGAVNLIVNVLAFAAAVVAAPFETMVRTRIGSRYQHLTTMLFAPVLPLALTALSWMGPGPWHHSSGLIGMGVLYLIIMTFTWRHYFHVGYVIAHPDKEEISYEDGQPFAFVKMLPKGDKWPMVRFIYEPALLMALAIILVPLRIVTVLVGGYMFVGAIAMMFRAGFMYFEAWEYLRDILDQLNMTLRLAGSNKVPAGEDAMRRVVENAVAQRPTKIPQALYDSVAEQAKVSLPAEVAGTN